MSKIPSQITVKKVINETNKTYSSESTTVEYIYVIIRKFTWTTISYVT